MTRVKISIFPLKKVNKYSHSYTARLFSILYIICTSVYINKRKLVDSEIHSKNVKPKKKKMLFRWENSYTLYNQKRCKNLPSNRRLLISVSGLFMLLWKVKNEQSEEKFPYTCVREFLFNWMWERTFEETNIVAQIYLQNFFDFLVPTIFRKLVNNSLDSKYSTIVVRNIDQLVREWGVGLFLSFSCGLYVKKIAKSLHMNSNM